MTFLVLLVLGFDQKVEAKFLSPTEYQGKGGVYRWKVKVDEEEPPNAVKAITPADVAVWEDIKVRKDSPRRGLEKEFFELQGKVVLVKCEEDGDLHVELADGKGANVVCEVPAGKPWDKIRTEVFGWAKVKFPCEPHKLDLRKHPVIRVTGKAFYDGEHKGKVPNRRSYDKTVTVWELHPVMKLEVVP